MSKEEGSTRQVTPSVEIEASYIRDHPTLGANVVQRIYNFNGNKGATVHYHGGVFHVQPVKFTGIEITAFENDGDEHLVGTTDDVNHKLLELKGD